MTNNTQTTPSLGEWVNAGWSDHVDDAQAVMERFPEGLGLVREAAHLPTLASLIVHVSANHLGRYADGLTLLESLAAHDAFEGSQPTGQAVRRSQAVLKLCAGDVEGSRALEEQGHPEGLPRASTSIRVTAVAAAALAEQGELERAIPLFRSAIDLAAYGPGADDPAARALAITANNLACELETKAGRSSDDDQLLELAAKTARTFWEVAGTWVQVKIAEYRLAMTHLALGNYEQAEAHARQSLDMVDANGGDGPDRFFPYEALARVRHAVGDAAGAAEARARAGEIVEGVTDEGTRAWFAEALTQLTATLAT